jgi:L-ascorbate metabolism protein UlaG (beta-lactamase superfamily)
MADERGLMTMADAKADRLREFVRQRLVWYGHASFRITAGSGAALYFDPYQIPAGQPAADLILISHEHYDHFDPDSLEALRGPETTVIVPEPMATAGLTGLASGRTWQRGPFQILAVPAYTPEKPYHPRAKNWLGYVVTVDGVRVYHAGDTDHIPEMKDFEADIALLPVGGKYTMNPQEAARAARDLQAGLYIPMHYGSVVGNSGDGAQFASLIPEREVLIMTPAGVG